MLNDITQTADYATNLAAEPQRRMMTPGMNGRSENPLPDRINQIRQFRALDTILEKALFEARMIAGADAGSIYMVHGNRLEFSTVQNSTLFPAAAADILPEFYADNSLAITEDSIAGFCVMTGQILRADDAHWLPKDFPCRFDSTHDRQSGYRTKSILAFPLKISEGRVVGAMQLINARNGQGRIRTFPAKITTRIQLFIQGMAETIEKGMIYRGWIMRALQMAELRDPFETGMHAQRVGKYAAYIYRQWAQKKGISAGENQRNADLIQLAAMQHDVGKLGISDTILNKPGKLTRDEYEEIKWHTVYGYQVFADNMTALDRMSAEIALDHHQKWNGRGYPGPACGKPGTELPTEKPKKGAQIPLAARITALADTFDALSSARSYKPAWKDADIRAEIRKNSGADFDPEIVAAFFDVFEVIKKIRRRYRESGSKWTPAKI